ncbi:MAG: DUF5318 family protein [Ilumatobacteraceae bacterium]
MTFSAGSIRGAGDSRGGIVDHRLVRRALINEYKRGRLRQDQVCDAHPELVRAAKNVGERTQVDCPICEEQKLTLVTYVFGPRLPSHGRCVSTKKEMQALNKRTDQLAAYIVEVCTDCRWHHLLRVLPLGGPKRRRAAAGGAPSGA